jgi:hypothetical protein
LVLGASVSSWADTVGFAVSSLGATTKTGTYIGDAISFYIPITTAGSGTYSTGGQGTTADTCTKTSTTNTCTGGTLDMWLYFSPVSIGPSQLTLTFNDLDIAGLNDPAFFLD